MFVAWWWLLRGLSLSSEENLGHGDPISPPLATLNTPEGKLESFLCSLAVLPPWEGTVPPLRAAPFVFTSTTAPACMGMGGALSCDLGRVKAEAGEPTTRASAWSIYFSEHSLMTMPWAGNCFSQAWPLPSRLPGVATEGHEPRESYYRPRPSKGHNRGPNSSTKQGGSGSWCPERPGTAGGGAGCHLGLRK